MLCGDRLAAFLYRKKTPTEYRKSIESNLTFANEHLSGSHRLEVVETQTCLIESFNETLVRCQSVPVRFHEMPGAAYLLLVRRMRTDRFAK
jgi:hypothetical protein